MKTQKIGEFHPTLNYTGYRHEFASFLVKLLPSMLFDDSLFTIHQQISAPWRSFKEERRKAESIGEKYESIYDWHQDCSNMAPEDLPWFILWSSEEPTHIRDIKTKEPYEFNRHDVIFVNNLESEHKAPSLNTYGRYVMRYSNRYISIAELDLLQQIVHRRSLSH